MYRAHTHIVLTTCSFSLLTASACVFLQTVWLKPSDCECVRVSTKRASALSLRVRLVLHLEL